MTNKKNKKYDEDVEFGVDSRYASSKEYDSEAASLMEARLNRMKKLSGSQIIRARLIQLKLQMDEYLNQPVYDNRNHFSEFLKRYIDTVYSARNKFAHDINIDATKLSQVINNHREPQEEFIMKLMIHSEMVYRDICDFQKRTWYQVYYQEKICDAMSSQDEWRPKIEKEVKLSESRL
ncbi:MAG: hypothetical protein KDC12_06150 [Flavobacteriales bacterium]|nr:hypothetical protein [Flavobacteriales bacterium]